MRKYKTISYYLFGVLYITAGALHFVNPDFYMKIMPPYLPFHLTLVYLSGLVEILLGIGLIYGPIRQYAAWGIIALLLAVFPANIYLAFNEGAQESLGTNQLEALWIRFPIQLMLIIIAWWQSKK
tara:strand:- start:397 stop:771 length:375 start_codon:yes stop_codon:yes gene_type:complete